MKMSFSGRRAKNLRLLVLVMLSAIAGHAFAWSAEGHQVVAGLAQAQLTPKARAEVNRLLAHDPGETLTSISTWADEHRSVNDQK